MWIALKRGSSAGSVLTVGGFWSGLSGAYWSASPGVQYALPKQVEAGAAVHGALDQLQAVHLPLDPPLLHGSSMAAGTAASSCRSRATKPPKSLAAAASSHGFNAAGSPARRIVPKPRTCSAAACTLIFGRALIRR